MPDLERIREEAKGAAAQREQIASQIAGVAANLAAERARLTAARAAGDEGAAMAATEAIAQLTEVRKGHVSELGRLHDDLALNLDDLLGADIELEGGVPLALLPVRIEVRSTADQASLRVRIFHDAIHVEMLDEGLSDAERTAGVDYWNAVWASGDTQGPWPALIAAAGARRASWVAETLTPTNLAGRPAEPPNFPDTPPRSSRPAVARTLPDRFYVRIEQDGALPKTVHGRPIPDELPVGLTDESELEALKIEGDDLPPIDESLKWLVDYKEAERLGMAVTVELPVARRPVRRLVVYGVRAALDPQQGAKRLEHLVRAHRFTDGAEFVPQGTPTNNTESARTAWSRRTPLGPPSLTAAADLEGGANAAVAATALGIDAALLASLPGAGDGEQSRAAAFNTALWTTTWGDAIEHLTPGGRANGDKRLDGPSLDAVRDHWVDNVRGRGPLPALRLGRQPYGVLPIVATDESWQPLAGGFVEDRLVPFLDQQIRPYWESAEGNVPTISNRPLDTALPEILGTDAVLQALRVRTALSPDPVVAGAMALTLPDLGVHRAQQQITKALLVLMGVDSDELDARHLLGKKTRSLALPLVDESDSVFIANLLQPNSAQDVPRSVLQVLLAHGREVERHNRESLAPPELYPKLRGAVEGAHVEIDRDLVYRALDAVLEHGEFDDRSVASAAEQLTETVGRLDKRAIADRNPIAAIAPETTLQQLAGVDPSDFYLQRTNVGLQFVGEIFHASRWAASFRAALETISKIESLEERRLLLAETLDCCSHRLDAWITSAATRRLGELRARGAEGAFIGAYGWLENIDLHTPAAAGQIGGDDVLHDGSDGGFIHAPGLTHAATAGVLRSGRLTHRRGDPNNEALDLDLSSTRVRDALALLDGMRRGQTLGALLGYRLERRLHERSGEGLELDRFIYVLRALAPLRGGKLTEPGQPVQESLAASDVVDGLRLMEIPWANVKAKLDTGPDDQRYIVPPDAWVPPSVDEAAAVENAITELERTHDAVADVLLAESVHQLVTGNPERAAAVLDVLGAGEAVPPELHVVRTPRTGNPIQHRVAIVVPEPPPAAAAGWNAAAPRALAEPRLEAWAQGALGDPAALEIASGHPERLADADLCALDVLYDADGDNAASSTLAARLRHSLGNLGDDVSLLEPTWELAGMLRALLATGRALDVADVGRPVERGAVGRIPDSAEIVARAVSAKDVLAAAAAAGDIAALAPFGIRPLTPSAALPLSAEEIAEAGEALFDEARGRVAAAETLLARATPPPPATPPAPHETCELAAQALTAVFGTGFLALPVLSAAPAGEADLWTDAVGPAGVSARPGADIRPWLARAGAFHKTTSAYGEALLAREAFGYRPALRVVQTPAGAYPTWAGLPFPEAKPPLVPLQSMVAEVMGEPDGDLAGAIAGVVLDEWTEVVPKRLLVGDPASADPPAEFVDVTTSGIALNAAAPGARPPQAILLALSPDGGRWNGDRILDVLDEALALARMRCVTLQQIPFAGEYLPALYFRDWSLQGEPTIDWAKLATMFDAKHAATFLQVNQ
jgi:hypothetical protein